MKYKLTKREKMLLYVLLFIMIVMGGWFLLLEPSLKQRAASDLKLAEKQTTLISTKGMYENYRSAKEALEEENKTFTEATTGFSKVLNNEDIDKKLTRLAILHSLRPVSLSIGETQDASLQVYNASKDDEAAKEDTTTMLKSAEVTITVEGTLNDVYALADTLKDDYSMKLRQFSYASGEEKSTHTLNFTIYMLAL